MSAAPTTRRASASLLMLADFDWIGWTERGWERVDGREVLARRRAQFGPTGLADNLYASYRAWFDAQLDRRPVSALRDMAEAIAAREAADRPRAWSVADALEGQAKINALIDRYGISLASDPRRLLLSREELKAARLKAVYAVVIKGQPQFVQTALRVVARVVNALTRGDAKRLDVNRREAVQDGDHVGDDRPEGGDLQTGRQGEGFVHPNLSSGSHPGADAESPEGETSPAAKRRAAQ